MPDGSYEDFPDDATDEEILAAINETQEPPPAQLRAGTGSFWGDIAQDAANIYLPENYASQVIQRLNPGSQIRQDEEGRHVLQRKGGSEYYLNKPGASYQDALNVLGALSLGGGSAKLGTALLGKAAPKAGASLKSFTIQNPMISGGTAGATYSGLTQLLGETMAPEGDFSLRDMIEMGFWSGLVPGGQRLAGKGLDAAAEVTGAQWLRAPLKALYNKTRQILSPKGEFTEQAKIALREAGIDEKAFTPQQRDIINSEVVKMSAATPAGQGRQAAMVADEISPTRGMVSQFPSDVSKEAGTNARSVAIGQINARGQQLGPTESLSDVGERLGQMHQRELTAVDDAYAQARRVGGDAQVEGQTVRDLQSSIQRDLEEVYDPVEVRKVMADFPQTGNSEKFILGPNGEKLAALDAGDPVTIRQVFEWRSRSLQELPGKDARRVFENNLDDMVSNGLAQDLSEEAIEAYRKANADFREYAIRWRDDDAISKVVSTSKQGATLKYDPENTANLIFNASEAGFITKPGARRTITKLKDMLGEESAEFQSVRNAIARRALKLKGEVNYQQADVGFGPDGRPIAGIEINGTNIFKHWSKVKEEGGDILEEAFPPEVMAQMENFVRYARLADKKIISEANQIKPDQMDAIAARIWNRVADAHFRLARSAAREAGQISQEQAVRNALRDVYGDLFPNRGANLSRPAAGIAAQTLWEDSDDFWTSVFDSILQDIGMMDSEGGLTIPIINGTTDRR